MESKEFLTTLKALGLNETTSEIYLSLLGKRRMNLSEIAKSSGIKRGTCYEHLDSLLNNGFIYRIPVGKRMFYAAVSPKKVLADFARRTASLGEKISQLEAIHDVSISKPQVAFYEGKRELNEIYSEVFETVADVYSIFPADTFFESFTEKDWGDFDRSLGEHALKSKDLFVSSKHIKKLRQIRKENGSDNKIDKILPEEFKSNIDVLIFGNKVALMSLRDLSAVVIENKDIVELFRSLHNFMWKHV